MVVGSICRRSRRRAWPSGLQLETSSKRDYATRPTTRSKTNSIHRLAQEKGRKCIESQPHCALRFSSALSLRGTKISFSIMYLVFRALTRFFPLSSIHSALTERSLNFSGMEAQPKMEKLMKLFESSDPFLDSRNLESISLNATLTRNPKKNLQVTCLEEADTGIDFDFRTDL